MIIQSFYVFRLKSIDLVCMKKLDTKVNIIPIIAKADTISKTELQKFKVSIINYRRHKLHCIMKICTDFLYVLCLCYLSDNVPERGGPCRRL